MAAALTDERAAQLVALLPASARETLRKGPVPWGPEGDDDPDGDCRVCAALDPWMFGDYGQQLSPAQRRADRAAVELIDWHQGWDLKQVVPGFLLGRGLECFRRCVVIYRAAGWEGEVEAPPEEPEAF